MNYCQNGALKSVPKIMRTSLFVTPSSLIPVQVIRYRKTSENSTNKTETTETNQDVKTV